MGTLAVALLFAPAASQGDDEPDSISLSEGGQGYVAEIVDSVYLVGPAEFFALDLPADPPGVRAVHLLGTITVTDRKGDIQVRLFRSADYQGWLKKRGGPQVGPFWTSKRARTITLDHDLTEVGPCVILLDNGYSMRTSKRLRTQLQIQYQRVDSAASAADPAAPTGVAPEDDIIIPRANTEEESPPPPPPPPDEE